MFLAKLNRAFAKKRLISGEFLLSYSFSFPMSQLKKQSFSLIVDLIESINSLFDRHLSVHFVWCDESFLANAMPTQKQCCKHQLFILSDVTLPIDWRHISKKFCSFAK